MNAPSPLPPSFSAAQRVRVLFNVIVSVAALAALTLMANYLSTRHYRRLYWSDAARFELAEPTRRVLAGLTNEVKAVVLFDREHALFPAVRDLLSEYAYRCPRLKVETVDYQRQPQRAALLAAQYQLTGGDSDLVIFENGSRFRVVRAAELSDYDLSGVLTGGKEVHRSAFKGEPLFTGALAALAEARQGTVYFLAGHGEHDPASDDGLRGYSRFAGLLRQKNLQVRPLQLLGDAPVPADCQLLVVAGPRSRLSEAELDRLDAYLNRGGRLLALLSFYHAQRAPTGLENRLARWGVAVGDNYVLDPRHSSGGSDIVVTNFLGHPIVRPLRDQRLQLLLARSVMPVKGPGSGAAGARVDPLFASSAEGFTASQLTTDGTPGIDAQRDVRGAVPLALAVEKGSIAGVSADLVAARVVVVGESLFLANQLIVSEANLEFASLAVNWLLDRPQDLTGLAARPLRTFRIVLTREQMTQVQWLLLGVLPGAVLAVGGLVWWRRRA